MVNTIVCWLMVALFFLILELGHPGLFFFLAFSFGAFSALIASYCDQSLATQCTIFFGVTLIALYFLRLFLKKFHHSIEKTNVYALIGKQGNVVQDILLEKPGYVKIEGEIWLARSSQKKLEVGSDIVVIEARGAHLLVEQKK